MTWRLLAFVFALLACACSAPSSETIDMPTRYMDPTGQWSPRPLKSRVLFPGYWKQGGYWDRDLGLFSGYETGEAITTPLVPQEGVVNLLPVNNPIMDEVGIGSRNAAKMVPNGASSSHFTADGLASLMNGSDKAITVAVRFQRINAASYTIWGFGSSADGTDDYCEGFISAGGLPNIRKDAQGEAVVSANGVTNLQFTSHVVVWVLSGTQVWTYVDGVLEAGFPKALDTTSISVNRFTVGAQRRSTVGGGFDGLISFFGVRPGMMTAAEVAALSAGLLRGDAPTIVGRSTWPVGDSTTQQAGDTTGFRRALYDYAKANAIPINLIGTRSNGAFPDNEHSGNSGHNLANILGHVTTQLGTGAPYTDADLLVILWGGINTVDVEGFDLEDAIGEYRSILDLLVTTVPTVRIIVSTLPPINPATHPTESANLVAFNSGLPAEWADFETDHPGVLVQGWDPYAALGGAWVEADHIDHVHLSAQGNGKVASDPVYGLVQAAATEL